MERIILEAGKLHDKCELTEAITVDYINDNSLAMRLKRSDNSSLPSHIPLMRVVYFYECGLSTTGRGRTIEEAKAEFRKELEKDYLNYSALNYPPHTKECQIAVELKRFVKMRL